MTTAPDSLSKAFQYCALGRLSEAETIANAAISANSQDPRALHLLGCIQTRRGNPGAAFDLFSRSAGLTPANAQVLNSLGEACVILGRRTDALLAFDRALAADPLFVQ